jgi:hypothetical protein
MFQLDNIDDYIGLQALISTKEFIQLATIVGGSNVAPLNLGLVTHEGEDHYWTILVVLFSLELDIYMFNI